MAVVDRRLLGRARPARRFVAVVVVLGVVNAVLVVAQAWLVAAAVTGIVDGRTVPGRVRVALVVLVAVVAVRAVTAWTTELVAHRCSASVKSQLRRDLLRRSAQLGPGWLTSRRTSDLETLATRGLDALDEYFARYLPQTVLAVVVPLVILTAVATSDPVAAAVIQVTVPLVPLFMALVGVSTRTRSAARLRGLQTLAGQFLDSLSGLSTLRACGGAAAQARRVAAAAGTLRRRTMATLKVAFVSSLVLELVASLSVAVVAVAVGLRLVSGELELRTGLFVLVLAPEAYQPLRTLAGHFHASADGRVAADQVFEVLDTPPTPRLAGSASLNGAPWRLELQDVTVRYPGRPRAALSGLSFVANRGDVVALVGPSGSGKTTALNVLVGLVPPEHGRVTVAGRDLADLDLRRWRRRVAWVPQRPFLFARSLRDNIALGDPAAPPAAVEDAARAAGLDELRGQRPDGLDTMLGEHGHGLSAGERQRVALARAFLLDAELWLLDEPTAGLDGDTEVFVVDTLRRRLAGRTVEMATHRPALVALADRLVGLDSLAGVGR